MNDLRAARLCAYCADGLEMSGLSARQVLDYEGGARAMKEAGKPKFSAAWMDPSRSFIQKSDAHWILLYAGEDCVGGIAARRMHIDGEGLSSHMAREADFFYGSGTLVRNAPSKLVDQISGKVGYLGELFIARGENAQRSNVKFLVLIAQVIAFQRWRLDWTYAFIMQRDVARGQADQYGFSRTVNAPQVWKEGQQERSVRECLVASSREDLGHFVDNYEFLLSGG